MSEPTTRTDVLVVGAGPSGLMAAVCLARLGVEVTVVDAKSGPTRESRALALQARSMEIYDQLGLVDRVLAEADRAPRIVTGYRARTFAPISFDRFGRTLTPYPGIYILEQSRNERILSDAYLAGGGDLRWQHRVTDLRTDGPQPRPVRATLESPQGTSSIEARWCIAADGASSWIREHLGLAFEGSTNPLRFYVVDAVGTTGLVEGSVNLRVSPSRFLLAFPMGAPGHHRLIGVAADDPDDRRLEATVRAGLAADFAVAYDRSDWFSSYRVHHRLADRFREGPVFLIGDAAHVHSPVGGQGMNTGLQDAHNLACKLADVRAGRADPALLDRYEAERRPVAQRLVGTTDEVFARVTSASRIAGFVRGRVVPWLGPAAVRLVPALIGTGRIYGYLGQLRIHYWSDPGERARRQGHRDPVVGRRLPWSGDNFAALQSMSWQVHGYGVPAPALDRVARSLGLERHRFPPDRYRRLSPDLLYLVRPDGFVAAAAAPDRAADEFAARLG
ncbi:FAD-dependent monooxygenase [Granulicoccus phenolivorans]|uniref:FAD-dependent monooxygenase n=1 Tax=Granulicoccus phenolivorans TaxID=266854 RepID=UPI00047A96FE|nr:FAD-dependent monooxygenase [Granulicoccus phenolivorans]